MDPAANKSGTKNPTSTEGKSENRTDKVVQNNIRASKADTITFAEYCQKTGMTQPEAFNDLMNQLKLAEKASLVPERQTEIETYKFYLSKMVDSYTYAINLAQTTRERILNESRQELDSKELLLLELQSEFEKLEKEKARLEEQKKSIAKELEPLSEKVYSLGEFIDNYRESRYEKEKFADGLDARIEELKPITKAMNDAINDAAKAKANEEKLKQDLATAEEKAEQQGRQAALDLRAAVISEREAWQGKLSEAQDQIMLYLADADRLAAENAKLRERLRKAGISTV